MSWQRIPKTAAAGLTAFLLLFGLLVITQADRDYRTEQVDRTQLRARILAANVVAAVDFGDLESARETTDAFGVDPSMQIVAVYDATGRLLTGYARGGVPLPQRAQAIRAPEGNLTLGQAPILRDGKAIGSVLIGHEIESFSRRMIRFALISLLVLMAALIVGILGLSQAALRRANDDLRASNEELILQMAEREKAESALRQAQKMESIGQLTGGIAHDFNNMLAIVIGSLDIAQRRFASQPERALLAIGHALEGANRAASLTRRLLAFARQAPLQPRPIDANQLVANMSEMLRRTLGEGVVVDTLLAPDMWRTHADPGQVENAILNLCVNARDAMDGHGRLAIETANCDLDQAYAARHEMAEAGEYVMIAIGDNGPGMPQEVLDRAFEPFFTTKGVGKGTGLGLAQVYGFAKQSGGHVRIDTELGRGTTVKLYLPRYRGPGDVAKSTTAPAEIPRARATETILVVEDEEQVRRMSIDSLEELGYTVIEAADAQHALAILGGDADVTLLFTDVVMPNMNGRELADRARQLRPDLRVLYTTGYTRNAVVHDGVVDQDVAFLSKPFTMEQLASKVRDALHPAS